MIDYRGFDSWSVIKFATGLRNGICASIYWFVSSSFYAISFKTVISYDEVCDFSRSIPAFISLINNLSHTEFDSIFYDLKIVMNDKKIL